MGTIRSRDGVHIGYQESGAGMPLVLVHGIGARLAAAHTLPREVRAHLNYRFDPARLRPLTMPTLLLLGEASPPLFHAATDALAAALPTRRAVVLPEQQHAAMDTAPGLFAREVVSYLD